MCYKNKYEAHVGIAQVTHLGMRYAVRVLNTISHVTRTPCVASGKRLKVYYIIFLRHGASVSFRDHSWGPVSSPWLWCQVHEQNRVWHNDDGM